ncbi:MAG: hypothetical protein GXP49_09630 [Deltaproteobacteria bacterium]|nr:hypothetical protein [Deltaproteobacteria bacterium]
MIGGAAGAGGSRSRWILVMACVIVVFSTHFESFGMGLADYDDWWPPNLAEELARPQDGQSFFEMLEITAARPPRLAQVLPAMVLAVAWAMGGGAPFLLHLFILLAHILCALALYRLSNRLGVKPGAAWTATLLFCASPWSFEIGPLAANMDWVMVTGLLLFSASLFMDFLEQGMHGRYVWSIVLFLTALTCRETAVIAPVLFLALLVVTGRTREKWPALVPYIVIAAAAFMVLFVLFRPELPLTKPAIPRSWLLSGDPNAAAVTALGIVRGLFQANPGQVESGSALALAAILGVAFFVLSILSFRSKNKTAVYFFTAWTAVMLVPLAFVSGGYMDLEARLFYPASAGLLSLASMGLWNGLPNTGVKKVRFAAAGLMVLFSGSITVAYESGYVDSRAGEERHIAMMQALALQLECGTTLALLDTGPMDEAAHTAALIAARASKPCLRYVFVKNPRVSEKCPYRFRQISNKLVLVFAYAGSYFRADVLTAARYLGKTDFVDDPNLSRAGCLANDINGPFLTGEIVRYDRVLDILGKH